MKRQLCKSDACKKKADNECGGYCYACAKRIYRKNNPLKAAYQGLKSGAKRRNIEFTLTLEQFTRFCEKYSYLTKKGRTKECMSIDRDDVTKGYIEENIKPLSVSNNSKKRHLEYVDGVGLRWLGWIQDPYNDVPF